MYSKDTTKILFWTKSGSSVFLSASWQPGTDHFLLDFSTFSTGISAGRGLNPGYFHKLFPSKCSYQNSWRDGKIMFPEVASHVHSLKQRSLFKDVAPI